MLLFRGTMCRGFSVANTILGTVKSSMEKRRRYGTTRLTSTMSSAESSSPKSTEFTEKFSVTSKRIN